jgi:ABC-type glycerol-3-phosphate transport system substrate-binding protein
MKYKKFKLPLLVICVSIGLSACGGGSSSSTSSVTNNGGLANPSNFTMPSGGVATVPPTGSDQ